MNADFYINIRFLIDVEKLARIVVMRHTYVYAKEIK